MALNQTNQLPHYARRTLARQQQRSETIQKPLSDAEVYQKFSQLSQAEQQRIDSLPPSMKLTALRQLGTQQTTKTIPKVEPTKLPSELDIFAKALPDRHRQHLEQYQGDRKISRIWELKEYLERTGELPKV